MQAIIKKLIYLQHNKIYYLYNIKYRKNEENPTF